MAEGFICRRGGSGDAETGTVSAGVMSISVPALIGHKRWYMACRVCEFSSTRTKYVDNIFSWDGSVVARGVDGICPDTVFSFDESTGTASLADDTDWWFANDDIWDYYIFD